MFYVIDGNSLSGDNGPTTTSNWFNFLVALTLGVVGKNYARSSNSIIAIDTAFDTTSGVPFFTFGPPKACTAGGGQWSPRNTGVLGYYFIFEGTNDLGDGLTATSIYSYLTSIVSKALNAGYTRVIIFTIPPDANYTGGQETQRLLLNTSIRTNAAGATQVIDLVANSAFTDPFNTTYFLDGVHFTILAHNLIASIVKTALDSIATVANITYTDVLSQVTGFCKADVPQGGKVAPIVETAIQRTYYNIIRSRPFPELLQNRTPAKLAGAATTGLVSFDIWGELLDVKQVDFSSGGIEWTLDEIDKRVTPAAVDGKPRAYRKVGSTGNAAKSGNGDRLYLDPFGAITESTDQCFISWWKLPPPFSAGFNLSVALHSINSELVDRSIAEVLNYYGSVEKAKMILMKYQQSPGSSPSVSASN